MNLVKPASLLLVASLAACAQTNTQNGSVSAYSPAAAAPVPDCVFSNQTAAPGWVCDEPLPGVEIQAVGIAERSPAGQSYMKDMAKAAALGHLAEQFKVKVAKMVKQYIGTTGMGDAQTVDAAASSTIKTISSKMLEGARMYRSRTGPEGRMYVMVGLDAEKTKALVKAAVKNSMKNEKALWQEFKAQKSHDEMAAGIAAMED